MISQRLCLCLRRSGDNTDELVKVILKYLPYGPQFYDEDTVTDQPERQIVAEHDPGEGLYTVSMKRSLTESRLPLTG